MSILEDGKSGRIWTNAVDEWRNKDVLMAANPQTRPSVYSTELDLTDRRSDL